MSEFDVDVTPTDDPEFWAEIAAKISRGEPFTLRVKEPQTEREFRIGDRITVPFDNGSGPAEVTGVIAGGYLSIRYGPRGRYTTSIHRSSVIHTDRVVQHHARVMPR